MALKNKSKQYGGSSKKKNLNIEFPHDPAIPLPGMFPKELKAKSQTSICTPMVTAALFHNRQNVETTPGSTGR